MKKIKIFLASSITDLKIDRIEVGDFVRQLNDIYFDRGIRFSLIKCDDYDNAIAAGGKQAEYDAEIRDSELCLFLFFRKVGDYTRHEFEVALDAFKNCKRPKIVTYFKYVETPEEAAGEVKSFMQFLDGEIRHYYNIYQSIDTLKLGLLMQIKLMGLDAEEPKVENGKVMFGGEAIADTANIPLFTGNTALAELKARLERVTKEYYSLREKYRGDPDNDDLYAAYSQIASQKAQIESSIRDAEKAVLEAANGMFEQTAHPLSPRQIAAYRALEQGKYQDALEILDFDEIVRDLSHNEEMADGYIARIQTNVEELLQRIEVLSAHAAKENAAEIGSIFETVASHIKKFDLDKQPLYNYAAFLGRQNDYNRAIEVASQLEYYYSDPSAPAADKQRARLWNLLGSLYSKTQRYGKAEEAFQKSIALFERLAKDDVTAFGSDLAMGYNNLAYLYQKMQRYREAEERYVRALGICERLARRDSPESESNLAQIYGNLGTLYSASQRYDEAEAAYQKALGIGEWLLDANPALYGPDLAGTYVLFGALFREERRYQEGEAAYQKALELYEKFEKDSPAALEPALSTVYNNLGNLYNEAHRFAEAEEAHKKALGIRERLAKIAPAAFEPDLAQSYGSLGLLYKRSMRYSEAEAALQRELELYEKLAKDNPAVFERELADSYNNFANLCIDIGHFSEAETAYLKSIGIYERLAKSDPDVFAPELAMFYNNLGILYGTLRRTAEAEKMFLKSIGIYERLTKGNFAVFAVNLANNYNNLGTLYNSLQRYDEAEPLFAKSVEIYEQLRKRGAAVEPDLANAYGTLGEFYHSFQRFAEAEALFTKSVGIYEQLRNSGAAVEPHLAYVCLNFSRLYGDTQRYDEAEAVSMRAIDIYKRLARGNPDAFEPELARAYLNHAILSVRFDEDVAIEYYQKAYVLAKKYPQLEHCAIIVQMLKPVFEGD